MLITFVEFWGASESDSECVWVCQISVRAWAPRDMTFGCRLMQIDSVITVVIYIIALSLDSLFFFFVHEQFAQDYFLYLIIISFISSW